MAATHSNPEKLSDRQPGFFNKVLGEQKGTLEKSHPASIYDLHILIQAELSGRRNHKIVGEIKKLLLLFKNLTLLNIMPR